MPGTWDRSWGTKMLWMRMPSSMLRASKSALVRRILRRSQPVSLMF